MLRDYALIPDIFDEACYSQQGICPYHLKEIKDELLNAALARSLYDGALTQYLVQNTGRWHTKGKELIRKLLSQNRFYEFSPVSGTTPADDIQWAHEAIASHRVSPLRGGVILSHSNAPNFQNVPIVSSIERLDTAQWWRDRTISIQVRRQTLEYIKALYLVLAHSNSLMFIDPHLDPSKRSYREFHQILLAARRKPPVPKIEIHRVGYYNSGRNKVVEKNENWEATFRSKLGPILGSMGTHAEVFIWEEFHRRYLITDDLPPKK